MATKHEVGRNTRPIDEAIGLREDTTIASIILYSNGGVGSVSDDDPDKNFLKELDQKVSAPTTPMGILKSDSQNGSNNNEVLNGKGSVASIKLDGSNDYYGIFNNFILTSIREQYSTIQKVHLNFSGSWNVFFFGDNPVVVNLEGGLLDSEKFPYYQEFMTAYTDYLSGTKVTENRMSMVISYDGKIIEGFLLSVSNSTTAAIEGYKGLSMQLLVKKITWARYNGVNRIFNKLSNVDRIKEEYLDMSDGTLGDPANTGHSSGTAYA